MLKGGAELTLIGRKSSGRGKVDTLEDFAPSPFGGSAKL
jgi:hypothetical protein